MIDPEYDEIDRILLILQNEDGSWGSAESLGERLYSTGWVLHALAAQNINGPIEKCMVLLRDRVVAEIEQSFVLANYINSRRICGLLSLIPFIFQEKLWSDKRRFVANLEEILDFCNSKNWINSQIASYAAYFLQETELSSYAEDARNFLDGFPTNILDPFAMLGSKKYLANTLKNSSLIGSLDKLPDEELSHLLVAFAVSVKGGTTDLTLLELAKQRVISIIQKRHLTELDKRISKEILDTLLLLRSGVDKHEMQIRLGKLGSSIYLREVEFGNSSVKLVTEIPSKGLLDILGRIDLIVLSAYVFAINNLGEKVVYIVPERDYIKAKPFFMKPTFPVPTRRLLSYESVLSVAVVFIVLLGVLKAGILLSTTVGTQALEVQIFLTAIIYMSFFGFAAVMLIRFLRYLFPELALSVTYRIPETVKSSIAWRKLAGE